MTLNHTMQKNNHLSGVNLSLFRADPDLFNDVESTIVHSHANRFVFTRRATWKYLHIQGGSPRELSSVEMLITLV